MLLCIAVGVMAQTEQGKIRIGGSSSLDFINLKHDGADGSTNMFDLNLNGGYFIMDNLSIDVGLGFSMEKYSEANDASTTFTGEIGARYYLPVNVFAGAGFDFMSYKEGESVSGTGVKLKVGYSWFVNDNIAIEPIIGYRIGLTDKDKYTKYNQISAQVGISLFF